jgi:DnaJ homologue, subfamily C, member 28, conserved domain
MTERKPRQQGFTSWIDQQIADAENRGVFENLPGAGRPLNIKPTGDGDFGQAWIRDYARREGVTPGEFLPTPLKLRREIEDLAETVGEMRSEAEVRETFGDLNRRIVEWRRIPVGPPIHVPLVNIDDMVARWRAARTAKAVQDPAPGPQAAPSKATRPTRRHSWLRRLAAGIGRRLPGQLVTNRQRS